MTNHELGNLGESLAEHVLVTKGYQILERNWRIREGEVDLIARDHDQLVFVEVKTRISDKHGTPEEAVNDVKQSKLGMLGQIYMSQADEALQALSWRIDVVAVRLTSDHRVRSIQHYEDAVRFDS